jgi:hypothetical protein
MQPIQRAGTSSTATAEVRDAIADLDLPSGDPSKGIEEIRRRTLVAAGAGGSSAADVGTGTGTGTGSGAGAGAGTAASADAPADAPVATASVSDTGAVRQRTRFTKAFGGAWVINIANRSFQTRCRLPNFKLCRYFDTMEEAQKFAKMALGFPGVTTVPIVVPANIPFLLAESEDSARHAEHVHSKLARVLKRHERLTEYRARELQGRVATKSSGPTGLSDYVRAKDHLREEEAGAAHHGHGALPPRKPLPGEEEDRLQRQVAEASAKAKQEVAAGLVPVPAPLVTDAVPEAVPEEPGDVHALAEWPSALMHRSQVVAVVCVMPDDDEPSDSPGFPSAAGWEPMVVAFGGAHKSVEDAKAFVEEHLSQWCTDISLNIVDVGEWLWPTEVDPDKVPSKYRTDSAAGSAELQTIMDRRTSELGKARKAQDRLGSSLPVSRPNVLPSMEDAASVHRDPVRVLDVQQLTAEDVAASRAAAAASAGAAATAAFPQPTVVGGTVTPAGIVRAESASVSAGL